MPDSSGSVKSLAIVQGSCDWSRDPSARLWLANLQATIADKQSTKTETKSLDHLDLIKTVGTGQVVSDIYKLFP